MIPFVKFFGVRRLLNRVIAWINKYDMQAQETTQFRNETEARLRGLEECLRGPTIKRLPVK